MTTCTKPRYAVEVRQGWSYIVGSPVPRDHGPWRYEWEAQEHADRLNRRAAALSDLAAGDADLIGVGERVQESEG